MHSEDYQWRVSWPRQGTSGRQYTYKQREAAAVFLVEKLRAEGYKKVQLSRRKVEYGDWEDMP